MKNLRDEKILILGATVSTEVFSVFSGAPEMDFWIKLDQVE